MFDRLTISPLLSVVLGATCISFSAVWAKLTTVSPDVAGFYRVAIGGGCLVTLALLQSPAALRRVLIEHYGKMLITGLFLALDLCFWHRAIEILGPGVATILINFQVFFLALFGWMFLSERLSLRFVMAIPLAFAGLILLIGIDANNILNAELVGIGCGLAAALWLALYTYMMRHNQSRVPDAPVVVLVALASLASAVCFGTFFLFTGISIAIPTVQDGFWLLLYGVGSQALGWMLISHGLPHIPMAYAGLTILIMPALSLLWDILFFGHSFTAMTLTGGLLALCAIWMGVAKGAKSET